MTTKYPPRRRKAREIPWGWKTDPDDHHQLLPIDEQLDTLQEAKQYLKDSCSLRDVAQWMTARTGRGLSHAGLAKIIKREITEKKAAAGRKGYRRMMGLPDIEE